MINAVLFDFDQTLVDSRALADLRAFGIWEAVRAGIPGLQLYPGIAEVLAYLRAHQIKFGIISRSPKDAYVTPACAHLGLQPDVIIGCHEVTRQKPHPEPYLAGIAALLGRTFASPAEQTAAFRQSKSNYQALRALGVYPSSYVAVGDACNDVAAARGLFVSSVGAMWGAGAPDEVYLAQPTYVCDQPADLIPLLEDLKFRRGKVLRGDAWAARAVQEYDARKRSWRRLDTSVATGGRPHLRNDEEVYHLRHRLKGSWNASVTNGHISAFKVERPSAIQLPYKQTAAELFAAELAAFMAGGSTYLFVPTSKRRDDPAFDNRNDLVAAKLTALRPDLRCIEPITLLASKDKASGSEDPELRKPAVIMANYQWHAERWSDCPLVYVIDDVLTMGGHQKATHQFLREHVGLGTRIICLAWALHN